MCVWVCGFVYWCHVCVWGEFEDWWLVIIVNVANMYMYGLLMTKTIVVTEFYEETNNSRGNIFRWGGVKGILIHYVWLIYIHKL